MRAAIIENDVVCNIIEVETLDFLPGLIEAPDASIGDIWDGEAFTKPYTPPPAPIVPSKVTMRQARLALLSVEKLAQVEIEIDALPSPQKEAARIEWDYSSEVHRHKGLVITLGAALGFTDEQLDQLFITASTL